MDKILEALKGLLPEDQVKTISEAVKEMLADAKAELENEANAKLEEAFYELKEEKDSALENAEKIAYEGYSQAWGIIQDQRNRMSKMQLEYQAALDENSEQAYQMIQAEKEKNQTLATDLYEQYDQRLAEIKEHMIDKLDSFLQHKGSELYEQARRDVLSDPCMAEHKVTLDRIVDITSRYMSEEDRNFATSSKLEEAIKENEMLNNKIKILEGTKVKLSLENTKLNESLIRVKNETLVNENNNKKVERKESVEASKNVSGRGHIVLEEGLIAEYGNKPVKNDTDKDTVKNENFSEYYDIRVLAGIISNE